ncbi:FkbM family methyltransferase [Haloprofundus salilacus]|uniref:FkbM family methyltransferase n=1 Tax=Haloprofundus salilacus TaxID=2876190 RepID=UPI001CCE2AAB|nr:FkbM family methyltransferase [Haloprofundus salilacus]
MTVVGAIGDLLRGTRAHEYATFVHDAAVRAYLRSNPRCLVESCGAQAVFTPTNVVEWGNLNYRIWEEDCILRHLLSQIRPDDVFFDVGANIGIYSCLVGNLLTDGSVVPFEPYPPNADRLEANLEANGIAAEVVRSPLSDCRRATEFNVYDTPDSGAQHGSLDTTYPIGTPLKRIPMETTSGDALVKTGVAPPPTVTKVDVQGVGIEVLTGLSESLAADRCRLVYVETHGNHKQITELLQRLGFSTHGFRLSREQGQPAVIGYDDDAVDCFE